jgi:hypothetical protein
MSLHRGRRSGMAQTVCVVLSLAARQAPARDSTDLLAAEQLYAEFLNSYGARETIDSGLVNQVDGKDRDYWAGRFATQKQTLTTSLERLTSARSSQEDAAVLASLKSGLADFGGTTTAAPEGRCSDASRPAEPEGVLRAALLACFREIGNHIQFAGHEMTRVAVLQLLESLEPEATRKQLFLALRPLWEAVDGDDGPTSPYRRRIAAAAAEARTQGSPIDGAARSLGLTAPELESALLDVLEVWRRVAVVGQVEPWDYRFRYAAASRALNPLLTRESLRPKMLRYFRDLGADPIPMRVTYDLDPRAGKTPFAYTDLIRIGQSIDGAWRPAAVRVSESVESAGLFTLDEMIHETGHAVHFMAVRARPAYFEPDNFLAEAFANVPAWSLYEPEWQRRYLGRTVCRAVGLRERYALAMLDIAWTVFEIRMLREPNSSPNRVWTDLTSHYLGIVPHPDWAWWALRTQLVDTPGYMANYGAGAILTAAMRERIRQSIGSFDAGNARWYPWVSEHILRYGSELPTEELVARLVGGKISAQALIADIRGVAASDPTCAAADRPRQGQ